MMTGKHVTRRSGCRLIRNKTLFTVAAMAFLLFGLGGLDAEDSGKTNMARLAGLYLDGNLIRSIIVPDDTNALSRFAAEEINRCLKVSMGITLPVVAVSVPNLPKPAFLLGASPLADALGLSPTNLAREGFYLKTTSNYVAIVGDDHPVFTAEMMRKWYYYPIVEREAGQRVGTMYGTYTFLKKVMGANWYFPGPLGEIIPCHTNLTVPCLDLTVKPSFEQRHIWAFDLRNGTVELPLPEVPDAEFQVKHVWRLHSRQGKSWTCHGSHSMQRWGILFGKDHPDYFALVKGRRLNDWGWNGLMVDGLERDFCWAGSGCITQQIKEMRVYFTQYKKCECGKDRHPWNWVYSDPKYFPIGQNDGKLQFCECKLCRAWYEPGPDFFGTDISDLYYHHVVEVAKIAKKEFPGRYIMALAYNASLWPPKKVTLPDNVKVVVAGVSPALRANPKCRELSDQLVREWRKLCEIPMLWEYTDAFRSHIPGIPLTIPRLVAEELKQRADVVGGFFFCHPSALGEPGGPFSEPELYLASELMWDISQDTDRLLAQFYKDLYGSAAVPVRDCYDCLEQIWINALADMKVPDGTAMQQQVLIGKQIENTVWTEIFTPERLAVALNYLKQARGLVGKNLPEWQRLNRLESQLTRSLGFAVRGPLEAKARSETSSKEAVKVSEFTEAPEIDGLLTDAIWRRRPDGWMKGVAGAPPHCKTAVWIGRDASHFFVAVQCMEPCMEQLAATVDPSWPTKAMFALNDDVEVFLDTENNGRTYYHFAMDAAGQRYAAGPLDSGITNIVFTAATSRINGAWCVEFAIPFAQLAGTPKPGTRWGINVTRTRRPKDGEKTPEYNAWFPSGTFQQTAMYGCILF